MWLLDKMLRRVIKTGELVVTDYDGTVYHYGNADPARPAVKARLTDKGASTHIVKDPRVGAGEVYMDGRLVFEQGDIRDLVLLIRENVPWEQEGDLQPRGALRKSLDYIGGLADQVN